MPPSQKIFLTGFMGSGKSTQGKKLAAAMQLKFIDLDRYIEEKEKTSIPKLFESKGEESFRQIESACLRDLIGEKTSSVISLGGGTVCFNDNVTLIKEHGLLVYLQMTAAALLSRLQASADERPLLKNLKGEALLQSIQQKLEEREYFYTQAHVSINGLNLSTQLLHQEILAYIQKNKP